MLCYSFVSFKNSYYYVFSVLGILCYCVLCIVLYVNVYCTTAPGGYPTAVNKYIIYCGRKDYVNDTIGDWTRDLSACTALPQSTAPRRFNLVFRHRISGLTVCVPCTVRLVCCHDLEVKNNFPQSVSMVRCVFVSLRKLCARSVVANVFQEDAENWRFSSSYVICLALICTRKGKKRWCSPHNRPWSCRWGVNVYSLTSALDGGGWLTLRPDRFTPGKESRYPFYRRLGGPTEPVCTNFPRVS